MKKAIILVLMILVVASTLFAGNLEVNEKTMMMTYTYVVENNSPYTSYGSDRFLRAKAMSEFAGILQRSFELNSVNLSQVEYEYQPGKILMTMSFEIFYNLNLK